MKKYDASVIIPVYNQKDALRYTLDFFNRQTYPLDRFEIIVINDGSTDGTAELFDDRSEKWQYDLKIVNQINQGRATARNRGISESLSDILIFCDADRLPDDHFVAKHIASNQAQDNIAVIGACYDYFGRLNELTGFDTAGIKKLSRLPQYYKKVMYLYDTRQTTDSPIAWVSFLVGNASVKRDILTKTGVFNERFKSWGFEHFELGVRLLENHIRLISEPEAINYHLPHPRDKSFIIQQYETSGAILSELHPSKRMELLKAFLMGEISLQDFETGFGNHSTCVKDTGQIYFKL
jgi:glycosyltransferase involved in cell wall biosynthesis